MKPLKTLLLGVGLSGAAIFLSMADPQDPAWWEGGAGTADDVLSGAIENNYGVANVGQAKWMADRAHAAMEASLPGGAGFELEELFSPSSTTDNYGVLNLGQAKALAKPFYDKLISLGYNTRAGIEQSLFEDEHWTHAYPWDPSTPSSENYYPANIGQLKVVFGFDLAAAQEASFRPVIWTEMANSLVSYPPGGGSRIEFDGTDTPWQWGAEGVGRFYGDGALRYQPEQDDKFFIIGTIAVDSDTLHGFCCWGNTSGWSKAGELSAYQVVGGVGSHVEYGSYGAGTELEIRREGTTIRYFKDGALFHTSEVAASGPLKLTSQFFQDGAAARNCLARGLSNPSDDSDGDGMTDAWEEMNGLNPHSASDGGSTDSDSDGFTNLEEFLAGTKADDGGTDPGDRPGITVTALQVHTPLSQ